MIKKYKIDNDLNMNRVNFFEYQSLLQRNFVFFKNGLWSSNVVKDIINLKIIACKFSKDKYFVLKYEKSMRDTRLDFHFDRLRQCIFDMSTTKVVHK